jgi:hypothetical protein
MKTYPFSLYSKYAVEPQQLSKMVKYCRRNLGNRGEKWEFDGGVHVQFMFKEKKDRTWFYFVFAHDLEEPYEAV